MSVDLTVSPPGGRREQRKVQLRKAVKDAAWRLVGEHGYPMVTVEQIAAAAGISIATFYRHFDGKDDAVMRGWLTPNVIDDIAAAGRGETLSHTVCMLFASYAANAGTYDVDLLTRLQVIDREPSLRACLLRGREQDITTLAELFARHCGRERPTHEIQLAAGLVIAAGSETLWHWVRMGGVGSLGEMLDRAAKIIAPALDGCEAAAVADRA